MRLETEGELESGLPGSDDEYLPHSAAVSYGYGSGWGSRRAGRGAGYSGDISRACRTRPSRVSIAEIRFRASMIITGMCAGIVNASRTSSGSYRSLPSKWLTATMYGRPQLSK